MKSNLLFDFRVNKVENTIYIKREFAAGIKSVWDAWTKPDILDKWWAPKPYRTETKILDLREGGMWLYAMISPKNEVHWSKADYKKIEVLKSLSWLDAFCDENGKENAEKPRSLWTNIFTEDQGITTVTVTLQHDSFEELEKLIAMGFKEGFTMALGNLDEILKEK